MPIPSWKLKIVSWKIKQNNTLSGIYSAMRNMIRLLISAIEFNVHGPPSFTWKQNFLL